MANDAQTITYMFLIVAATAAEINEYITHYEHVSYDPQEVHRSHIRARRSTSPDSKDRIVNVKFKAHKRFFNLRLKRDLSTFSSDLVIHGPTGKKEDVDTSHVYHGHLEGEPNSYIFGSITDGVFEGKIISSNGSFYVEKAHKYFPKGSNKTFHSVIYSENDVRDPYENKRSGHVGGCGVNDETMQWMEDIQNLPPYRDPQPPAVKKKLKMLDSHNMYSQDANENNSRRKREANNEEGNRNTCSMFIRTDPLLWKHISEQEHGDPDKTKEEISKLISSHIQAVNNIYGNTKFDGKREHRNINFKVLRIKIDDDTSCKYSYKGDPNPFCNEHIDSSSFLELHTHGNYSDFCLAYTFTYRDFSGGILGVAWHATVSGGGVCETCSEYYDKTHGTSCRSLNTGIITFLNYNTRVTPKISQLTLAHEIGHNFGSPHDYPAECRPGGIDGNFLMFSSATNGYKPNNMKFSKCSIGNISRVLDAVVDSKTRRRNCFTELGEAICGNKIVEDKEECDCGFDDDECKEKCCYPRVISEYDKKKNISAKGCTLRQHAQCSPSQGPCCSSSTCTFEPALRNITCKNFTDCCLDSKCDGKSAECPTPKPVENMTVCNTNTQVCLNGECSGSICLAWNMTECFLSSSNISNIDKHKLCQLACQNGSDTSTCRSTSDFAEHVGLPKGGIYLRPGSPCDNFQGYCDTFLKCRVVDEEKSIFKLIDSLFNQKSLQTAWQWLTRNWWAAILIIMAVIILMVLFVKCCAVHTPSTNPYNPPAKRFSDTIHIPINSLRRVRGGPPNCADHVRGVTGHPCYSNQPAHALTARQDQLYALRGTAPPAYLVTANHPDMNAFEMHEIYHH